MNDQIYKYRGRSERVFTCDKCTLYTCNKELIDEGDIKVGYKNKIELFSLEKLFFIGKRYLDYGL